MTRCCWSVAGRERFVPRKANSSSERGEAELLARRESSTEKVWQSLRFDFEKKEDESQLRKEKGKTGGVALKKGEEEAGGITVNEEVI